MKKVMAARANILRIELFGIRSEQRILCCTDSYPAIRDDDQNIARPFHGFRSYSYPWRASATFWQHHCLRLHLLERGNHTKGGKEWMQPTGISARLLTLW